MKGDGLPPPDFGLSSLGSRACESRTTPVCEKTSWLLPYESDGFGVLDTLGFLLHVLLRDFCDGIIVQVAHLAL
jgi:hypothetical protein